MIKLTVPKDKTDLPGVVNQGNFRAELKPGRTVETDSREFADYLIREYDLTDSGGDEKPETEQPPKSDAETFLEDYPADFPHRKRLANAGIPYQTASGLDRDGLIAVVGIGEAYADEILEYEAKSNSEGGNE